MRDRLFVFGSFADYPQGILAAVNGLTDMSIKCDFNFDVVPAKLRTAPFTDSEDGLLLDDSQFALRHENSLAPNTCAKETAPVPEC
jgi:hypothetical protein